MKVRTWLPAITLLAMFATRVSAQDACQVHIHTATSSGRSWPAPLDRLVSLELRNVQLRDLFERIAGDANFRISYSSDLLSRDRTYCVSAADVRAGQLLSAVLAGAAVDVVVAGPDHVVLAPKPLSVGAAPAAFDTVVSLPPLVVVGKQRGRVASTTGSTALLDGNTLPFNTATTLSDVLSAGTPGVWLWPQTGSALQYGSLRGVSSFGVNAPKVYIDGIPVANALIATRFAPGSIERIDVARGPDAGMQYGDGAMSGVTSITTRHDLTGDGVPHVQLRSVLGIASSAFAGGSSMTQDHALNLRLGGPALSTAANFTGGNGGEVLPGSFVRHFAGDASVRAMRGKTQALATFRIFNEESGQPLSVPGIDLVRLDQRDVQSLRQYTAGLRIEHQVGERWEHTFLAGMDGFSIGGVTDPWLPYLSSADSALRSVASAHRTTFRLTSTGRVLTSHAATATLLTTLEQSRLHQRGVVQNQVVAPAWQPGSRHFAQPTFASLDAAYNGAELQQDITGLGLQANTSLYQRVTLSGGMRLERHQSNGRMPQFAALPMFGASVQHAQGPIDLRVRFAAGKGIRWPQEPTAAPVAERLVSRMPLEPEEQTGIEAGLDLRFLEMLTLQVTRFDQTASRLIQSTTIPHLSGSGFARSMVGARLQNVGEISNRGWEVQAGVQHGPLHLTSAFSTVDSRVQHVALGYSGDLRPGDRMLAVPAQTISFSAAWTTPEWSTSITAFRAFDWINYDRLALNRVLADAESSEITGRQLRGFWRSYNGSTHLRTTATRQLTEGVGLWFEIENLLNRQAGEPDNATFVRGRSVALGVRASF